jgi:RNA polymerase sigma-32 factor
VPSLRTGLYGGLQTRWTRSEIPREARARTRKLCARRFCNAERSAHRVGRFERETADSTAVQRVARRLQQVCTEGDAVHEQAIDEHGLRSAGSEGPLLDPARERMLLAAALRGDQRAASELVRTHIKLVKKIAARYRRRSVSSEDLVSEGLLGLMEALRRFDVSQDTRFAAYACWWIRARIGQFALANQRLVRVPSTRGGRAVTRGLRRAEHRLSQRLTRLPTAQELAAELGATAADVAEVRAALSAVDLSLTPVEGQATVQLAADCETPEQAFERRQLALERQHLVYQALSKLSPRERQVVSEQYLDEHGRTLSALGADYGVSRQRVGQMLEGARGKLKHALAQVA